MIVTCPECATRYAVDDGAFAAGGRAVRCAHCGCEWYQIGPTDAGSRAQDATAFPLSIEPEPRRPQAPDAPTRMPPPSATPGPISAFEARAAENRSAAGRAPAERAVDEEWSVDTRRAEVRRAEVRSADMRSSEARLAEARRAGAVLRPTTPVSDGETADFGRRVGPLRAPTGGAASGGGPSLGRDPEAPPRRRSGGGRVAIALVGASAAIAAAIGVFGLGPSVGDLATSTATPAETVRERIDTALASAPSVTGVARGLVFVDYKYDLVERAEGPALEVWGRVANNGPDVALTPTIEIVSRDANGRALQRWLAHPEVERLEVGQTARFSSRLMYPQSPVHAVDLYIASR